jgi:hypothetical protein
VNSQPTLTVLGGFFIPVEARAVSKVYEKVVGGPIVLGITIEASAAPGTFKWVRLILIYR